ncbi:MAG TPA: Rossmann-like and DUF2520 domain-containing protein [Longimicrobiales bacterium]|nr:Rossmann-like and DUF2520 domain-containing protein [Longimicrobiales bacterium]
MNDRLVICGPGRVGLSLGAALVRTRTIDALTYYGRSVEPPPHPVFDSTEPPVDYRVGVPPLPEGTTILLLAVPDRALSEVAHDLAAAGPAPRGCVALHVSGALSADVLSPLHAAGYAVGSLHPLQPLADPWDGIRRLMGACFAVAGEPTAIAAARRIAHALDGIDFVVVNRDRPIYHAAAVFASNYVVALADTAIRLFEEAGVPADAAPEAVRSLMHGTLDNLEHLGVTSALTGPVARGDVDTVRMHLARLSAEDRQLYCALGLRTLAIARTAGLADERADELERILALS